MNSKITRLVAFCMAVTLMIFSPNPVIYFISQLFSAGCSLN